MRKNLSRLLPLLIGMALLLSVTAACTPAAEEPETPTDEAPSPPAEEAPTAYSAVLVAAEGVTSSATGAAMVEVGSDSIVFSVNVEALSNITMAHIHIAEAAGGAGPPGVWLYTTDKAPMLISGPTTGELSAGTLDATSFVGPLEGGTMADLMMAIEEGRAYVNVHTEAYPDGEISGFLQ
jgi:hypothetical protein